MPRLWYRYFFADGHLQNLLLTTCRDVAVVVVVVVVEVVADGGALPVNDWLRFLSF